MNRFKQNTTITTASDKCDIIIENIWKEIKNDMCKQTIKVAKWETPKYSKSEINKAGKIIANENSTQDEREYALQILNNWRSSHAYPLHVIATNLRHKNPNMIVAQRLKRLESITGKIKRFPEMELYRMQDLGGCRVILNDIDQVYSAISKYKNSRIRHKLKREYDYIKNPKSSGYRSYHMVYQFQSDQKDTYNKNMLIEIQFRTKLQHIWATAVEMMGIFTKSNLKSSQGDKDILRFFTLVSSVIAIEEDTPVCPNTSQWLDQLLYKIKELDKKHNIISTLSGLNVAIDYTNTNTKGCNYYILILDYEKRMVRVKSFKANNIEYATKAYNQIESNINDSNKNVVLVAASSFESLKEAYPNYFIDIKEFISMIKNMLVGYNFVKNLK